MRPGVWSYVFGSIGLVLFLGTAYYYVGAAEFVPLWALVVLWIAWLGLLASAIWLLRMSPGWVLAMPVLSVIVLAVLTATLEFIALLAG